MKSIMCCLTVLASFLGFIAWPESQSLKLEGPTEFAQSVNQDDDQELVVRRFAEEVRKEIEAVCAVKLLNLAKSYQAFFELDDACSNELDVACSEYLNKHVEKYTDQMIHNTWPGSFLDEDTQVTKLIVNGRECWEEPNEAKKEKGQTAQVSVSVFRSSVHVTVKVEQLSLTNVLSRGIKFEPEKDEVWKEAGSITADDIDRYKNDQQAKLRRRAMSLIVASLSVSLRLEDDQMKPTRKWVESSIDKSFEAEGIYAVSKMGMENLGEVPDCYSDEQREIFKLIVAGLN